MKKTPFLSETKNDNRYYFLLYTICFLLASMVVFCPFYIKNGAAHTLILDKDAWNQHFKALIYYGQYLRSIVKGILIQHELIIPQWEFGLGEGNDILCTLQYYVIGDPLAALSVFVPTRYMHIFYTVMAVFRLYLAGITFSFLCFHTGQRSRYAVLAGSMTYVFCFWGIYCVARHPFFINPMIYLPLLILGVERIINKKKPYLFILTVCLSAMSNFYFFYILTLLTVIYTIARLCFLFHKNLKKIILLILQIGGAGILGMLLSAIIFLPVCCAFLKDTRTSVDISMRTLFWPSEYYRQIPSLFLVQGTFKYLCMGFSVPVFLAVCLMFYRKKQYSFFKWLFLICLVIMTFPICGRIFNGFSYMTNRWSFAIALLAAYSLTVMWPSLMKINWKDGRFLTGCTTGYLLLCVILEESRKKEVFLMIVFVLFLLFFLMPIKMGKAELSHRKKQEFAFAVLFLSVFCNAFWRYSTEGQASTCLTSKEIAQRLAVNETVAVLAAAENDNVDEFYRYSGSGINRNNGLLVGLSSTCFYWSLAHPGITSYRAQLDLLEPMSFNYVGYDDRSVPLTLSSVRYYAVPNGNTGALPYGYSYVDTYTIKDLKKYQIYRNDYAMPLGYTYSGYISENTWDSYTAVEKQEAMLSAVMIEEEVGKEQFEEVEPLLSSREIPFDMTCGKKVTLQDNKFVVKTKNASVILKFDGLADCETYVSVTGLDYEGKTINNTEARLKMKSSTGVSKSMQYANAHNQRVYSYSGRHDFIFNMGYSKEAVTEVEITFSNVGTYSFDTLQVFCQPMDAYAKQVEVLKEDVLENTEVNVNKVTGTISLDCPKLLCLSIPYSEGWSVYVNGEKEKLFRANVKNMAVALNAGEYQIELRYRTPMLKEGFFISLFGLFIFAGLIIIGRMQHLNRNRR